MITKVSVDVFKAMMPVENQVALPQGPQSRNAELNYSLEMPIMLNLG
jgi:hypothetical protein